MPNKVRLLAMKTLLSARLAEGRIIIVDNDFVPERKTQWVGKPLNEFSERDNYIYITGNKNKDFEVASQNIPRITYTTYDQVTLTEILQNDKIMFNLDGILNMMCYLHEQTVLQNKPKGVPFKGNLTDELRKVAKEEREKNKVFVKQVA